MLLNKFATLCPAATLWLCRDALALHFECMVVRAVGPSTAVIVGACAAVLYLYLRQRQNQGRQRKKLLPIPPQQNIQQQSVPQLQPPVQQQPIRVTVVERAKPAERLLSVAEIIAERTRVERSRGDPNGSGHLISLPDDLITRVLAHCDGRELAKTSKVCHTLRRCFRAAAQARLDLLQTTYQLQPACGSEQPLMARLRKTEVAAVEVAQSYNVLRGKAKALTRNLLKLVISQIAWTRYLCTRTRMFANNSDVCLLATTATAACQCMPIAAVCCHSCLRRCCLRLSALCFASAHSDSAVPDECFVTREVLGLTLHILNDRRFETRQLPGVDELPGARSRPPHPSLGPFLSQLEERVLGALDSGELGCVTLVVASDADCTCVIEQWPVRVVWRSGPPGCAESFPSTLDVGEEVLPNAGVGAGSDALPKYTMAYTRGMSASVIRTLSKTLHQADCPSLPERFFLSLQLSCRRGFKPREWQQCVVKCGAVPSWRQANDEVSPGRTGG